MGPVRALKKTHPSNEEMRFFFCLSLSLIHNYEIVYKSMYEYQISFEARLKVVWRCWKGYASFRTLHGFEDAEVC